MKTHIKRCIVIAGIALAIGGCAVSQQAPQAVMNNWVQEQGGEIAGPQLERIRAVGTALVSISHCDPVRFHVMGNSQLTAYSWPSGDVYLSAGLVATATDDEIAATIAHELGHLINDGHIHSALSLTGSNGAMGIEERADQTAVALLRAADRPPAALVGILRKVAAASAPEIRTGIQERIAELNREIQ